MRGIKAYLVGFLLISTPVLGGEFGNVFGSDETEKASRQASATALEGIERAISGLRARELGNGNGAEQFGSAAQLLRDAGEQMKSVLDLTSFSASNFSLNENQKQFLADAMAGNKAVNLVETTSLGGLYGQFTTQTFIMADILEGAAEQPNAFRVMAGPITDYFELADAIVAVRDIK